MYASEKDQKPGSNATHTHTLYVYKALARAIISLFHPLGCCCISWSAVAYILLGLFWYNTSRRKGSKKQALHLRYFSFLCCTHYICGKRHAKQWRITKEISRCFLYLQLLPFAPGRLYNSCWIALHYYFIGVCVFLRLWWPDGFIIPFLYYMLLLSSDQRDYYMCYVFPKNRWNLIRRMDRIDTVSRLTLRWIKIWWDVSKQTKE
jgi:hypothetical protein